MSESLNESQSPLQLHNNTLISMGHLHTRPLSVDLLPVRIDPLLNVSNGFILPGRFEQMSEPAPQLEVLFNRLTRENVGGCDCSPSTMEADCSLQLFPQRRLVLPRLCASHTQGRRRDCLQPGLGDGLSTLLASTVLLCPQLDERPVDLLDLGLCSPIQTIEQPDHALLLPPLLHFAFDIAFEPTQFLFSLGNPTKQVTPLGQQLLPNIVD